MEALLFAYTAAATIPAAAIADIFEQQSCRSLSYARLVCDNLAKHEDERYKVYVLSNRYLLLSEGLLTLTSAVVAILAGPVCDKYGHRTLVGFAIAGAATTSLVRVFLALGGGHMLAHVFSGLTGGHVLMLACCYYVVTKRTQARLFRTIRFYLLEVAALLGRAVGWLIGWLLHSVLGHHVSLWTALAVQCLLLATLWASPHVRDSSTSSTGNLNQLRLLVSKENARRRPGCLAATGGYEARSSCSSYAAGAHRGHQLRRNTYRWLGLVAGYILAVPQGVAPVGLKSYFSKLVPADESGKFMALVTACESVFTVLSRVALSFTFDVASAVFLGLPFIVCAALAVPVISLSG
ncbi:hypothetical protein MTO96_047346 [Rhipicephalus appendiculatus]